MNSIKKIEFKLEYNEKILKETIENICFGKDINTNKLIEAIKKNDLSEFEVNDLNDTFYSKIFVINEHYNKIQDRLKSEINHEKSKNYLNKIGYKAIDIFYNEKNDTSKIEVINNIKDTLNNFLIDLYKLRKIDLKDLKINQNGLLTNCANNNPIINVVYDKNLNKIFIKEESIKNLNTHDLITIDKIQRDFDFCLEIHFKQTQELKETNSSITNDFIGFY